MLAAFGSGGGFFLQMLYRQLLILRRRSCFFLSFLNYLPDFSGKFGYFITNRFWREALLPGLFQRAFTDALRDCFPSLEQFFALLFRCLHELIRLPSH